VTLAQLQERIQSAILAAEAPGGEALDAIRDSRRADRSDLFLIYHEGYRLRLAEFISNDYATLRERLGDTAFGMLVEDYILSGPSRERNARWYASQLPDFMASDIRWRSNVLACDLARLERAHLDAFDAADADIIDIEALATLTAADWPSLRLHFHPSLRILDLGAGVIAVFESVDAASDPRNSPCDDRETIAVWRCEGETFHRMLDPDEAIALASLRNGYTLTHVCTNMTAASESAVGDAVAWIAGFMAQWIADGMVSSAEVSAIRP
jgi:hypothetical protein